MYVLVWEDYNCNNVERFNDKEELENRVAKVLGDQEYGEHIIFAGQCIREFQFEPIEVAVRFRAVETK